MVLNKYQVFPRTNHVTIIISSGEIRVMVVVCPNITPANDDLFQMDD